MLVGVFPDGVRLHAGKDCDRSSRSDEPASVSAGTSVSGGSGGNTGPEPGGALEGSMGALHGDGAGVMGSGLQRRRRLPVCFPVATLTPVASTCTLARRALGGVTGGPRAAGRELSETFRRRPRGEDCGEPVDLDGDESGVRQTLMEKTKLEFMRMVTNCIWCYGLRKREG